MNTSQSLKAASVKADNQVKMHLDELLRRCRGLADDGDDGMAYALANLSAAEEMAASLRETLAALKNGQPAQKRKARKPRKRKARPRKRRGPTLKSVQDLAIDAVQPGEKMTIRDLFQWCQGEYSAVVTEERMPAFASTFTKTFRERDDITLVRPHKGSAPAVYLKMGATVSPDP